MSRWFAKSLLHKLDNGGRDDALDNWLCSAQLAPLTDVREAWRLAGDVLLSILAVLPAARRRICELLRNIDRSNRNNWAGEVLNRLKAT